MSETRRLYLTTMGYVDLSEYLLKTEAETLYATIDVVNNKQDKLISGTNIKTINGTSILGSGNITIEGGGGSGGGEDNRYFTEFTVEEFIEGCMSANEITDSITELRNAVDNNKIICIPYNNFQLGFLIATYRKANSGSYTADFILETDCVQYNAYCTNENDFGDPVGLFGNMYVPYRPKTIEVETEDGYCNISMTDNSVFKINGEVNQLVLQPFEITNSSTVRFITGDDPSLEIFDVVLWANGNTPILESYTSYELSIATAHDQCYAVLVPFKLIE